MIFDIFSFVGREDSGNGHILKNLKFDALEILLQVVLIGQKE